MHWPGETAATVSVIDISDHGGGESEPRKRKKYGLNRRKHLEFLHNWNNSQISSNSELRTCPSKRLIFSPGLSSISLQLFNDTSSRMIFKLKTTEPEIIASQPARGFIEANSFVECRLTPIEIKHRMLLVIQWASLTDENQSDNDYLTLWNRFDSSMINIKKFQCLFEQSTGDSTSSRPVHIFQERTKPMARSSGSSQLLINKRQFSFRPVLFTFAAVTLLTAFVYSRYK